MTAWGFEDYGQEDRPPTLEEILAWEKTQEMRQELITGKKELSVSSVNCVLWIAPKNIEAFRSGRRIEQPVYHGWTLETGDVLQWQFGEERGNARVTGRVNGSTPRIFGFIKID